jgi:starch-binding outer membrane protein, SusD/RagB family
MYKHFKRRIMKTKISKYCLIIIALVTFSCDNLLDVTIRSSITGQNFWQSENDFSPYLTGIYSRYRSHMDNFALAEDRCEQWKQGYNARFSTYWAQSITPANTTDWTSYYGTIGHCNLLLEKIEPWAFSSTATKNRIMAETYALRAATYFYIARVWGDVPLVLKSVVDENEQLYPKTLVADIFKQINADIDKALSLFPEAGYVDKYRFSKPSVNALKADVKMWTGKVLGGGATDLNAAIAAITEVETSGVSLLTSAYGTVFDNRKNNEIVFSVYLNRAEYTSGQYTNCLLRFDTSGSRDNANDLPMSLIGQQAYCLSTDALALFQKYPADKRISRTYIPEILKGVVLNYWPNKFIGTKYADDRIPDSDIIIYRLSDLLLLKAEAYAALGQIDNALINLNKVRARAGIPDYTETTKALVEREILDERGRELFNEMKRWWDLVRAHKSGVVDIYQYIPNLKGKTTPIYWAVHTNVLAKNSKLVQTQGY